MEFPFDTNSDSPLLLQIKLKRIMKNAISFLLMLVGLLFSAQQIPNPVPKEWDKDAFYKLGKEKLHKDFKRALTYTVAENYVINGIVTFAIYVDEKGFAKIIDMKPKFKNDQLLLDDLNYVLRKTHKNWQAAQKANKPVKSIYYYKINFNTEVYDHD